MRMGQGVRTGLGHGGITCVLQTHFSSSFQNNPKNLDPSYKMDLDLWECLGRVKYLL